MFVKQLACLLKTGSLFIISIRTLYKYIYYKLVADVVVRKQLLENAIITYERDDQFADNSEEEKSNVYFYVQFNCFAEWLERFINYL